MNGNLNVDICIIQQIFKRGIIRFTESNEGFLNKRNKEKFESQLINFSLPRKH